MSSPSFTFRAGSLLALDDEQLRIEADRYIKYIYDAHAALGAQVIQAPGTAGGFNSQSGTTTVTGSKTGIPTGMTKVNQVVASIVGSTASNQWVTAQPSTTVQGAIDIFVWAPTSSSVNTPIASTTATVVHWWASGTVTSTA
jgi:hypothetical protein